MTTGWGLRIGEAVLGGVVLGLGLFVAIETSLMEVAAIQRRDRPAPVPVPDRHRPARRRGGRAAAQAFFGHIAHERGFELDWRAVALVSGGLIAADAPAREPGLDHRHHAPVRRRHARLPRAAGC